MISFASVQRTCFMIHLCRRSLESRIRRRNGRRRKPASKVSLGSCSIIFQSLSSPYRLGRALRSAEASWSTGSGLCFPEYSRVLARPGLGNEVDVTILPFCDVRDLRYCIFLLRLTEAATMHRIVFRQSPDYRESYLG